MCLTVSGKHIIRCKGISFILKKYLLFRRCSSGFTGPNCHYKCPYPWFGDDCKDKCECFFLLCHHKTGCPQGNSFFYILNVENKNHICLK